MGVTSRLNKLATGLKLEKMASCTVAGDLEPNGIAYLFNGKALKDLTNEERHTPVGHGLWRCRIGKHGVWHYGRTHDSAALAALGAIDAVL